MKTLSQFLEATERDLKDMGANENQVAELKRRQSERKKRGIDKGFTTGDDRNETDKKTVPSSRGQKLLPAGGSKPKTPADTGAALVRTRQSNDKQRAASGPAGGVRTPNTYRSGKDPEEKKKEEKKKKEKKDRFAGLRRRAGEAVARAGSEVEAGMDKEGKGLEGSKEIIRGERK